MPQPNRALVPRAASTGRRAARATGRRPNRAPRRKSTSARPQSAAVKPASPTGKGSPLAKILSPDNIQETMKNVGNLRNTVKNWLRYLQQAEQVLDTVFVTTNSLKETGVLDKLIKQRGKNLSTEDFTNILVALMNSPAGSRLFGGGGESGEASSETAAPAAKE
ncbi:MAG: hypothetical protein K6T78_03890 [Alicyclobacillus sp.]|nr:hypothetical protein [Alicyclobacillus sp.]